MPCAFNAACTGSLMRASCADAASFSTMSGGVLAGASSPIQMPASKPGMPASSIVGTSGRMPARLGCATAIGLSVPAATCGASVAATLNISVMRPVRRSLSAWLLPP